MAIDVQIRLLTEINKSLNDIRKLQKSSQSAFQKIEKAARDTEKRVKVLGSSFKKAGVAVAGFAAAFIAFKVIGGTLKLIANSFGKVTDAAKIQEDAINNLNIGLHRTGEFSRAASREIQDFASSLQQTTQFGDEAILNAFSLAQAFGATKDQAKELTRAAVEFASATGKSLEESIRQVSKTLGGFAGELGEINPAIKALTAEELKAGKAAKILIEQFGGTAQKQTKTYSGAVTQLKNSWGDLLEQIGFVITKNKAVLAIVNLLKKVIEDLQSAIKNNASGIRKSINAFIRVMLAGFASLIRAIEFVLPAFVALGNFIGQTLINMANSMIAFSGIFGFNVDNLVESISIFQMEMEHAAASTIEFLQSGKLGAFADKLDELAKKVTNMGDASEEAADDFGTTTIGVFAKIKKDLDKIEGKFKSVFDEAKKAAEKTRDSNLKELEKVIKDIEDAKVRLQDDPLGLITKADIDRRFKPLMIQAARIRARIEEDTEREIFKAKLDFLKKEEEARKQQASRVAQDLGEKIAGAGGEMQIKIGAVFGGAIGGIGGSMAGGEEGGRKLVSSIAGGLAQTIGSAFGPIGSFIGEGIAQMVDLLAQGPEQVRETVRAFAEAIPKFIEAIIMSVPVLIEEIILAIPQIIEAFIDSIPRIINSLIASLPEMIERLITGLINALPRVMMKLVELAPQIITAMLVRIPMVMQRMAAQMPMIAIKLGIELLKQMPRVAAQFILSLIKEAPKLIQMVGEGILDILEQFKLGIGEEEGFLGTGLLSSEGLLGIEGVPILQMGGKIPQMQQGGTVPSGFNNDSFLARLSSGENVITRSTNEALERFLAVQEAGAQPQQRQPFVINIGSRTIMDEINEEIESGRVLEVS